MWRHQRGPTCVVYGVFPGRIVPGAIEPFPGAHRAEQWGHFRPRAATEMGGVVFAHSQNPGLPRERPSTLNLVPVDFCAWKWHGGNKGPLGRIKLAARFLFLHCISKKIRAPLIQQHNYLRTRTTGLFPLLSRRGVAVLAPKRGPWGRETDEGLCCGSFVPPPQRMKRVSQARALILEFMPFERLRHLMAEPKGKSFFSPRGNPICVA